MIFMAAAGTKARSVVSKIVPAAQHPVGGSSCVATHATPIMLKHATAIRAIGFLLFKLGLFTLFINMVGVDLVFMDWLYRLNVALSFAVRFGMVLLGLILIYVGSTNWERTEA